MSAYSATTKQDCYSMEERGASHEASQTRIEKDNKAPRLSLPVSGFSNVDVQHLPSSTHDGSQDKPLSSDSNFQIRIAQSHTTLEHNSVAWYQIFKVLRNVRASRKVSGKEFNILNGSRGIKLAFSDWRSNVVISLLCASMSTALTVLSALWLDPMTKYSAEWATIIVFYNIDPAQDLDPLTTFDFHLPPGGLDQYGPAGHPNINISNGGVLCAPSATPTNITPK
ncbi:hypothetical protein SARC_10035 [Sphaeroforma arctica JP610]|uniref:Uncharacterized protein n=1 Tax=Sphaeroforma arctica JP610 TaxID=667725 RepID=A0A0L0FL59_9EUKA|nr:hypothetical protein SARC_10035 [Sphaeroforma arctica JP610]KNC77500.1 hypothetical protein SARC_10035 [Sphaeroforma arctica JP610]|eukprot:XP_014151402.1 hypothetical protein SARC_10035 [Sphaeroforma arctica JP610]